MELALLNLLFPESVLTGNRTSCEVIVLITTIISIVQGEFLSNLKQICMATHVFELLQ